MYSYFVIILFLGYGFNSPAFSGVYAAKLRFYFKYWGIFYENLQKKPVIPYIYQVTTRCKC